MGSTPGTITIFEVELGREVGQTAPAPEPAPSLCLSCCHICSLTLIEVLSQAKSRHNTRDQQEEAGEGGENTASPKYPCKSRHAPQASSIPAPLVWKQCPTPERSYRKFLEPEPKANAAATSTLQAHTEGQAVAAACTAQAKQEPGPLLSATLGPPRCFSLIDTSGTQLSATTGSQDTASPGFDSSILTGWVSSLTDRKQVAHLVMSRLPALLLSLLNTKSFQHMHRAQRCITHQHLLSNTV